MNQVRSPKKDTPPQTSRKRERGQGLVEFALMLPMFLLVILGVVEFGRLLVTYSLVTTASREAARFGASVGENGLVGVPYQDCVGIRQAAQRVTLFTDPSIVIFHDDDGPGGNAPVEYCQVGKLTDPIQIPLGGRVIVRVTATYEPSVPLVNLPPIPISSETKRTVLKDVYVK